MGYRHYIQSDFLENFTEQIKEFLAAKECFNTMTKTKLNSAAIVYEQTIPTEQLPLVGEVSGKFCG
jgi:hypothetical protein